MRYNFKCGDEIINTWVYGDDFHTEVTVYPSNHNSVDVPIEVDESGKFFIWNSNKIYLNDWIKTSMKELKDKIDRNHFVSSDDLCQAILSDGIDNVRFIVPLNIKLISVFGISLIDNDSFKNTICKVEERYNREVRQNYKLVLVPVEPDETVESSRDFYTSDMISLIESGCIQIYIEE